ncbi:MAG: hypothetical protein ACXVXM_09875 [Nocardioidaceae bacterium]
MEEVGGTGALESMYDAVLEVAARPAALVVPSAEGDPASTYDAVLHALRTAGS